MFLTDVRNAGSHDRWLLRRRHDGREHMRVNGLVLWLIDGPAHRVLPRGLTEISYTGPVSGRAIRLPAQSVVDGNQFVVMAGRPDRKRWWRAFRHPQPARLVRDGSSYDVNGQVLTGTPRSAALTAYLVAHPGSRRAAGPETPVVVFTKVAP